MQSTKELPADSAVGLVLQVGQHALKCCVLLRATLTLCCVCLRRVCRLGRQAVGLRCGNQAAAWQPCRRMGHGALVRAWTAERVVSSAPLPPPHTQDTSFYAESGGQCADTGAIAAASGAWPVEVGPTVWCTGCLLSSCGGDLQGCTTDALPCPSCHLSEHVPVAAVCTQDCIVAAGYVLHLGQLPEGEIKVGDAVTSK